MCVEDLKALHWTSVFSEKKYITPSLLPAHGHLPALLSPLYHHISHKPEDLAASPKKVTPQKELTRAEHSTLLHVLLSVFPLGKASVSLCSAFSPSDFLLLLQFFEAHHLRRVLSEDPEVSGRRQRHSGRSSTCGRRQRHSGRSSACGASVHAEDLREQAVSRLSWGRPADAVGGASVWTGLLPSLSSSVVSPMVGHL